MGYPEKGFGSIESGVSNGEAFVTIGTTSGLTSERSLAANQGLLLTDAGAGSTATISPDTGASANSLTGSPTLAAWYKANALVLNDGDAVGTWTDSSGNGRDLTQGTGSQKPIYKATASVPEYNGYPAVLFDGSDDRLVNTSTGIGTLAAYTMFLVAAGTTIASGSLVAFGSGAATSAASIFTNTSRTWLGQVPTGASAGESGPYHGTHILVMAVGSSRSRFYNDGNVSAVNTSASNDFGQLSLGCSNPSTPSLYFPGYILEAGVYSAALTHAQVKQLTRHLANKYSIPLLIPA